MDKKSDNKIEIGKIEGNVVISQDQKGGTTSHSINKKNSNQKRIWTIRSIIFLAAAIVTILAYFKIYIPSNTEVSNQKEVKSTQSLIDTITKSDSLKRSNTLKTEKKMNKKKDEKPINIGKVEGDVIISQNQSGGITSKNVEINTDRRLDKTNFDLLVNGLKNNKCLITVGVLGMGGEPSFLADQLLLAATQAGCQVSGVNHGIGFEPFIGVRILCSTLNTPTNSISVIESIFNKANIAYIKIPDSSKQEGSIYLYVGYKP